MTPEKEQDKTVREELAAVLKKFLSESPWVLEAATDEMATELAETVLDTLIVGEPARRAPYEQMKWAIINKRLKVGAKE